MARNLGTFAAPFNFKVTMQEAFDPRVVVGTKRELTTKATWPCDGDTLYLYNGLQVSVVEEKAVYMLIDINKALEEDYSGWLRIDAGNAEQVSVIDNLESDSAVAALSAKQGKVLMGEIAGVKAKLVNIYTYKGSKDTYEELPTEGVAAGDVWNVAAAYGQHPAGTNYAWVTDLTGGGHWDALGGSLDLSGYFTKTEVEAAIKVESDRADAEEKRLAGLIDANAQAIAGALGDISSQASSIEQLGISLGETNAEVAKKVNAVDGHSLISAEDLAQITTNKDGIATIHEALYTENQGIVKRIADLESLFEDDSVEGGSISLAGINAAISELQSGKAEKSALETLSGTVSTIQGTLDAAVALNGQQTELINGLSGKVTNLESLYNDSVLSLSNTVNDHTQSISDLNTNLGLVKADVDVIKGDYLKAADIVGKLDASVYEAKVAELVKADSDNLAAAKTYAEEQAAAAAGAVNTALEAEVTRAKAAEEANAVAIAVEKGRLDAILTGEGVSEALDSFKELQAWIETHEGGAAEILAAVNKAQGEVDALELVVAGIDEAYKAADAGVLAAAKAHVTEEFNKLGTAAYKAEDYFASAGALALVKATADAAAPQATTYTKDEVNTKIAGDIAAAFEWVDVK